MTYSLPQCESYERKTGWTSRHLRTSGRGRGQALEYQGKERKTCGELFLERTDGLIPWQRSEARIRRHHAQGGPGHRPCDLPVMLRVHREQLFYNLSEAGHGGPLFSRGQALLHESGSVPRFVALTLSESLSDESRILHLRHLLEQRRLDQDLFQEFKRHLDSQGLKLREGTITDASTIEAPSSTKNRPGARDPGMHHTKRGNQWHFRMKQHTGVDSETGVVHSITTTRANVRDEPEGAPVAARRRVEGVGRCGVSGSPPARWGTGMEK